MQHGGSMLRPSAPPLPWATPGLARRGPQAPLLGSARPVAAGPRPILFPVVEEHDYQPGDLQVCGAAAYPYANAATPASSPSPFASYANGGPGGAASYATSYAGSGAGSGAPSSSGGQLTAAARGALARAAGALRRYGFIGFWVQLSLSTVSAAILLFSAAFTAPTGPRAPLYLALVGISAGFLSAFWSHQYRATAKRMLLYLAGDEASRVKKQQVLDSVARGALISVAGLGATLIGVCSLVGTLVAKTLTNAGVNPFLAAPAAGYSPVLALDVFLVQAATNTMIGHFLSLLCSLWLLNVIGEGRGLNFQRRQHLEKLKQEEDNSILANLGERIAGGGGGYGGSSGGGYGRAGGAGLPPGPGGVWP